MRSNQTKKIIYGLIIVVLFGAMFPYGSWLAEEKKRRDLGEAAIGQIDTGSFMMKLFLLGGFRGIVANYLWIRAEENKRDHDWDRLKANVDLITKLQPHFLSIWTFQGWNLAYNVSVEWDAPEDKYEWIKQGIKFVQRGVENNKKSPDLIWDTAWFYYHKIGFADEAIILRRLFFDDDDDDFKSYLDPNTQLRVVRRDNFQLGYGWFSRAVKLVELDSSKPEGPSWDPGLVEANAKRAADDPSTIAYLGELDFGGSAISVPVTNNKSILQVSPYDGLTSLTLLQPGGPRSAGPERYYPSGKRTFARLVPNDLSQAAILVDWAREDGAEKIAIVHDDRVFGRALAEQLVYMADDRKLEVTSVHEVDLRSKPDRIKDIATQVAETDPAKRPDAVIYAGLDDMTADPMLDALDQVLPGATLYAASGVMSPEFAAGGTPEVKVVSPSRPSDEYPKAGQDVLDRLKRATGGDPPTEALYGYESMRLVLDAIDRAGPRAGNRATVTGEALKGDGAGGPLGALNLTRNGDVGDQKLALYVRTPTGLEFRTLRAPELPPPAAVNGEAEK